MANNKKQKKIKTVEDESIETKKVLIVFIVIILLIIGLYFISDYIVSTREETDVTNETSEVEIDYSTVSVGTILNRPYDEYYVIAYESSNSKAMYYASIISKYQAQAGKLKIYYCDLNNDLNKKYKSDSEKGNSNAKNISELSFGDITLIKIKDQKIVSYIEDIDLIKKTLQ